MNPIFKNIKVLELDDFRERFADRSACLSYLAAEKWQNGFVCRKCGHQNYCKGKSPYSRRCTLCKTEESATAHTVFHRCRIDLPVAFEIAYLACNRPDISSHELGRRLKTRQMTCWRFKSKIMDCLKRQGKDAETIEKFKIMESLSSR